VKSALELRAAARQQLHSYFRATDLEVGLLLHFGLEPKFHRIVELETHKKRTAESTDSTDCTDATDETGSPPRALLAPGDSVENPAERG
jgi:PD-(D/E)XK nuclease superfamily protein